jgi:hypothetical protein
VGQHPEVAAFEAAADAVASGDIATLTELLQGDPELVTLRSERVTHFDPARHRATLLHYVAANGVERPRQKTPANAVAIARALLTAGAQPNALADMYGGRFATMAMLASSDHPARAGVQVALIDALADFGASVDAAGVGTWASPLLTALAFGFIDAAQALVRHGADWHNLPAAAGLGRTDAARALSPGATAEDRQRALSLAAMHGHAGIVALLLDAGADLDRHNPAGMHAHATPLHQAAVRGHGEVVRLMVERGARLDLRDTIHHATPLDWARHGNHGTVARYLAERGAP